MIKIKYLRLSWLLLLLLVETVNAQKPLTSERTMLDPERHMYDVKVQIIRIIDQKNEHAVVQLKGNCKFCNIDFHTSLLSSLNTHFYEGVMDLNKLRENKLGKATVSINPITQSIWFVDYTNSAF